MKGQVRDWRANLYILARHVSKKDIPLCHNVGQLAHTHTHIHNSTHTLCDVQMPKESRGERPAVILGRPRFKPLAIVWVSNARPWPSPLPLPLDPLLCWQHMRPGASSPSQNAKCKFYLWIWFLATNNSAQHTRHIIKTPKFWFDKLIQIAQEMEAQAGAAAAGAGWRWLQLC